MLWPCSEPLPTLFTIPPYTPQRARTLLLLGLSRRYEPRKWVLEHYGNDNSGKRLLEFVKENFGDRVKLPKGTTHLFT